MRSLYLDCFSGAAGDMLCAALLDLGADLGALERALPGLGLRGVQVRAERCWQGGLAGTRFHVEVDPAEPQPERNLAAILTLLEDSTLPGTVKQRAADVFRRLGEAEAKVHGAALEEVHFHEVGAVDSVVDVVGFCVLHEDLGAPLVVCSPVSVGEGFVETAHGKIPLPSMATLELLRGVPLEMSGLREELVTPTGAALLTTFCREFHRRHRLVPEAIGYGLGTRVRSSPPNAVRAVLCRREGLPVERIAVLRTNLDNATGEEIGSLVERCRESGALDVCVYPVLMKKGRPGHVVEIQVRVEDCEAMAELVLREAPTLGVRGEVLHRWTLERHEGSRRTSLDEVRTKEIEHPGGARRTVVEFSELERLARETGLPLPEVRRRVEDELL